MRRLLLDLNVVLDVLLDRAPHVEAAAALWALAETRQVHCLVAAHAVTTLHYLAGRSRGQAFADRCVADLLSVFAVAPVDEAVVRRAAALGWPDFEDAVTAMAAEAADCAAIVTRDGRFGRATLPALPPAAAVATILASAT